MHGLKRVAVSVLTVSVSLLTLTGVLSIWDVLGEDVLWKSISTIGILSFASLIILLASSALEDKGDKKHQVVKSSNN